MTFSDVSAIERISAALSLANLKHQVIANNIANRDTEGYRRLAVRFDAAMERGRVVPAENAAAGIGPVSLEQDLVALSANSAHYEAMTKVLSRYFSIARAITNYSGG